MALFLRYKNRVWLAKEAGFYRVIFSPDFLPYRTITSRYLLSLVWIIINNIKQVYIINLWLFYGQKLRKNQEGAHDFGRKLHRKNYVANRPCHNSLRGWENWTLKTSILFGYKYMIFGCVYYLVIKKITYLYLSCIFVKSLCNNRPRRDGIIICDVL